MERDLKERLLLQIAAYNRLLIYPSLDPAAVKTKIESLWHEYDSLYPKDELNCTS